MDEPFGALDAQTRLQRQELLLNLWEECGMTVVFVTHDIDEAILLSDRVLIMSKRPGRIQTEIPVPLVRPRSADLLTNADFMEIKRECMHFIRFERNFRKRRRSMPKCRFSRALHSSSISRTPRSKCPSTSFCLIAVLTTPAVEELARRLAKEGIQACLDKWHLIPGDPWQPAIEKALGGSPNLCGVRRSQWLRTMAERGDARSD